MAASLALSVFPIVPHHLPPTHPEYKATLKFLIDLYTQEEQHLTGMIGRMAHHANEGKDHNYRLEIIQRLDTWKAMAKDAGQRAAKFAQDLANAQ